HHRPRSCRRDGHARRAAPPGPARSRLARRHFPAVDRRHRRTRIGDLLERFMNQPVLALLLRQRARLLWNRLAKGPRRVRRLIGTGLALMFTAAFVVVAGLNAGVLGDRVARLDPAAAPDALPVLLRR